MTEQSKPGAGTTPIVSRPIPGARGYVWDAKCGGRWRSETDEELRAHYRSLTPEQLAAIAVVQEDATPPEHIPITAIGGDMNGKPLGPFCATGEVTFAGESSDPVALRLAVDGMPEDRHGDFLALKIARDALQNIAAPDAVQAEALRNILRRIEVYKHEQAHRAAARKP